MIADEIVAMINVALNIFCIVVPTELTKQI